MIHYLNLIDHLDRFVSASSSSSTDAIRNNTTSSLTLHDNETAEGAVNFTKASCTLDASVKIYSYRVDDVHLTSYKVLANLNRTETGGKNKDKASSSNNDQEMDSEDSQKNRREKRKNAETETLETNLGKYQNKTVEVYKDSLLLCLLTSHFVVVFLILQ